MVIKWVVSNWRRRKKREQVTHYIQTYRTASGSISNGELIKYHRRRIIFPSIHTMLNSTPLHVHQSHAKFSSRMESVIRDIHNMSLSSGIM